MDIKDILLQSFMNEKVLDEKSAGANTSGDAVTRAREILATRD